MLGQLLEQSRSAQGTLLALREDLHNTREDIHNLQNQQQRLTDGLTHANSDLQNLAASVRLINIDDETACDLAHARELRRKSERWNKALASASSAVLTTCVLAIVAWVGVAVWDRVRVDVKTPPAVAAPVTANP